MISVDTPARAILKISSIPAECSFLPPGPRSGFGLSCTLGPAASLTALLLLMTAAIGTAGVGASFGSCARAQTGSIAPASAHTANHLPSKGFFIRSIYFHLPRFIAGRLDTAGATLVLWPPLSMIAYSFGTPLMDKGAVNSGILLETT